MSSIATLSVDGDLLVESNAEDLDCPPGQWECKFRFKGERVLNFEVHETSADGHPQDATSSVQQKIRYSRECEIKIVNDHDVRQAQLRLDGILFEKLKSKPSAHQESPMRLTPQAFSMSYPVSTVKPEPGHPDTYPLVVPFKVNEGAPLALEAHMQKAKELLELLAAGLENLGNETPKQWVASPKPRSGEASPGSSSWLPRLLGLGCCTGFDSKAERAKTQIVGADFDAGQI